MDLKYLWTCILHLEGGMLINVPQMNVQISLHCESEVSMDLCIAFGRGMLIVVVIAILVFDDNHASIQVIQSDGSMYQHILCLM